MRAMAILVVAVVLGAGFVMAYVMYSQLDTKTVVLSMEPELAPGQDGAMCGDVAFEVNPRTLGQWQLAVEKGRTVSGVVEVSGGEDLDIALRIKTPHNRLAFSDPKRRHTQQFELSSTIRGDYMFEFDNRHSTFTSKDVTLSVCVA